MKYMIMISYSHDDLDSWEEGHKISFTIDSDHDISSNYGTLAYAYLKAVDSRAREYQTKLVCIGQSLEVN